ncbi:15.8g6 protein [Bracoviriform inaniti]|uniref:15.8g6 protein n=1 Tax=Bracoviriform inaniti TaxID=36344 RepID=A8E0Z5_9VIRU|nr:15.8g6 protein [Bracoviriform inaniti]CAO98965.1 15.8g6 protein [Bracoviriform inaniti]
MACCYKQNVVVEVANI